MASANATYGQKESSDQNFDYMFKILIIGNSSVGKTSFLFRYADDSFTPAFVSTVGIDFKVKTIYRNDKRIKLQIWDTAGQERYRTITTAYYRGAMGFILMYDITNEESFNAVQDWSTQIKTYSWDNAQVLLVGNKCDMEDERVVVSDRGRQLSEQLGFEFFEASAKDNINVKQTFERLVDIICERMTETMDNNDQTVTGAKQGPQLNEQPQRYKTSLHINTAIHPQPHTRSTVCREPGLPGTVLLLSNIPRLFHTLLKHTKLYVTRCATVVIIVPLKRCLLLKSVHVGVF
uniref:Ras-related protein Rab-3 n=1 Tax=Poecilia reticulata TaxID=8081 RepID=A0A3P9NYI1_POERE